MDQTIRRSFAEWDELLATSEQTDRPESCFGSRPCALMATISQTENGSEDVITCTSHPWIEQNEEDLSLNDSDLGYCLPWKGQWIADAEWSVIIEKIVFSCDINAKRRCILGFQHSLPPIHLLCLLDRLWRNIFQSFPAMSSSSSSSPPPPPSVPMSLPSDALVKERVLRLFCFVRFWVNLEPGLLSLPIHRSRPVPVEGSFESQVLASFPRLSDPSRKDDFAWVFFRWLHVRLAPYFSEQIARMHDSLARKLAAQLTLEDWLCFSPLLSKQPLPASELPPWSLQYRCWHVLLTQNVDPSTLPPSLLASAPTLATQEQCTLLQIPPREVARQLTMLDLFLLNRVQTSDVFAWFGFRREPRHGPIFDLDSVGRRLLQLVISSIATAATAELRTATYIYFVRVMEQLFELKSFHGLVVMNAGLSDSRVRKLGIELPGEIVLLKEKFAEVVSSSRGSMNLRKCFENPSIPFIGVYLLDLSFIRDGNSVRRIFRMSMSGEVLIKLRQHSDFPHQLFWPVFPILSIILSQRPFEDPFSSSSSTT